uniref:Uncharacterized protein n=1 Tax=Opuntia streptacantha TaxID=393608 RepID=A0A7C9A4S0_OPUST
MRQTIPTKHDYFLLTSFMPILQLDKCTRSLTPVIIRPCYNSCLKNCRVTVKHSLYFNRAYVLSPRNDYILQPILDFNIVIGVFHSKITRVKPTPFESLLCCIQIL